MFVHQARSALHLSAFVLLAISSWAQAQVAVVEEIRVWGEHKDNARADFSSPVSVLTPDNIQSINVATTEDLVKFEPSMMIRRRFIGDANGTLGIRGSNMFQTSRSMVFADGQPLHYLLQSRWSGAPRWTLVSASEIAQVEVLYGPFSAEYSGNAMGGVVVIETAIPQEREFHVDGSFFTQTFDAYGFDDDVSGYKGFVSYGDKLGAFSYYLSYNHLDNESQPQSFYYGDTSKTENAVPVTGAISGNNESGAAQFFFGDTGVIDSTTNNYKFKAGYEFGDWFALLNVAYEDRKSLADSANSYLRDAQGNSVWGGDVVQDGKRFSIPISRLNVSEQQRESLSLGLRVKGPLTESIALEANISQFDILKDQTRSSAVNPGHPDYSLAGQVSDFDDTGWHTADVKFSIDDLGFEGASLITGLRYEAYELNTRVFNSDNYPAGSKDTLNDSSGGETSISAAFAQLNWAINDAWDIQLGGRFESWKSNNGYYSDDNQADVPLQIEQLPSTSKDRFSPKFSTGFQLTERWKIRYSVAQAYRFPIVEELYSQNKALNSVVEANPDLKPEDGQHHNLLIERSLEQGYMRVNFFHENINDVIESQFATLAGGISVTTFVPIDEVETSGVEFIVNTDNFLLDKLDVRFNLAYTDSEIIRNSANPAIEGNRFPRMPRWRSNLLTTYHITDAWDLGGSIQYASRAFSKLDNSDTEQEVYGAQDGYTRLGLKTNYRINAQTTLSLGVDNLTNEIAYVAHPWPGRTLYMNFSYDL